MLNLIPKPASILSNPGEYRLDNSPAILISSSNDEVRATARYLATQLQSYTGWLPVVHEADQNTAGIHLRLEAGADLGEEGYELSISTGGVELRANCPAGLFYAVQTLLQLVPIGSPDTLTLPALTIRDTPRFEWRGAMLDVARHFFGVEDVKRFIDLIVNYKINRLHLHLSDDQGWRIEIKSWPRLAKVGGSTQVGGNGGGYYTQEQYKEIVEYARTRYLTIVPEIDTPSHTNAALASYAELNASEESPPLYEGVKVGFSSFWIESEITYKFLYDVFAEIAALTPAPYLHFGGDEAWSTPKEEYKRFIKRVQEIILSLGKTPIGWTEIGEAEVLPGTIAQHWHGEAYLGAKRQGAKFILSPATRTYLDMKYDESTPIGLTWAALISVKDSYDWEPESTVPMLEESDILGMEAPLWTETVETSKDIEYLVFPRLLGIAELAWSARGQNWQEYRQRLAAHGKRLEAQGINFYRAPEVDWD